MISTKKLSIEGNKRGKINYPKSERIMLGLLAKIYRSSQRREND